MRLSVIPLIAAFALVAGNVHPLPLQAQTGPKTFTFGAMFPLSGPAAEIGEEFKRGLDMAIDDVNSKGGIDGWQLKSVVVDHKGTALGGAQAMNQLVNLDKVPFVLTTFTGVALTAQPIAAQNSVLLMNVGGTSNNLLGKPWLYNDQVMGDPLNQPLAQYSYDNRARTAALLASGSSAVDALDGGYRLAFVVALASVLVAIVLGAILLKRVGGGPEAEPAADHAFEAESETMIAEIM